MTDTNHHPHFDREEKVFLVLAGFFLCAMTLLNVIGITRFIQLGPLALAVGVLPYPLTFLCTDLMCELYGRKRANFVVTLGLVLNLFIISCLWLAQSIPSVPSDAIPPWQILELGKPVLLPSGEKMEGQVELFTLIYACSSGAVFASMLAYIAAQYCDVHLFHFFKRLTKGKHLWIRNNFSTVISQGVDSFMVVAVTFGASFLAGNIGLKQILLLMGSNYLFKFCVAVADTLPFYFLVYKLKQFLGRPSGFDDPAYQQS